MASYSYQKAMLFVELKFQELLDISPIRFLRYRRALWQSVNLIAKTLWGVSS